MVGPFRSRRFVTRTVLRDDLRSSLRTAWCASALVVGGWACGGDAGAPTTPLAPLTPLQAAIVQRFQQSQRIIPITIFIPTMLPTLFLLPDQQACPMA